MRIELPEGILDRIMARIHRERRILTFKRRLAVFSVGFIGSGMAFIPAFGMAQAGFAESGFLQFFSLLFSDFGIVAAYWQSFAMSLAESLPVMSLAIFLAVIFIFFESLRFLTKNVKFIFTSKPQLIIN